MSEELSSIIEYSEDITDAEPPPPLPARDYPAEIISAQPRMSQKDTKYTNVGWLIAPENFPADFDASAYPDGLIVYQAVGGEDNPTARFRLRMFCEAIGATMGRVIDVNDWIGLNAVITLDVDVYEGIPRNRVRRVVAA